MLFACGIQPKPTPTSRPTMAIGSHNPYLGGDPVTAVTNTKTACGTRPGATIVDWAHEVMQAHLECVTAVCQQRQAALAILVKSGRYQLSQQSWVAPERSCRRGRHPSAGAIAVELDRLVTQG
jgi:hypothetical protein